MFGETQNRGAYIPLLQSWIRYQIFGSINIRSLRNYGQSEIQRLYNACENTCGLCS